MKNLTIYTYLNEQDRKGITHFIIAEDATSPINKFNLLTQSDVYKIIDSKKPSNVILVTSNMHGKEVVGLLGYFMSKRYKPVIFDLTIKNSNSRTSTMVIKFQYI